MLAGVFRFTAVVSMACVFHWSRYVSSPSACIWSAASRRTCRCWLHRISRAPFASASVSRHTVRRGCLASGDIFFDTGPFVSAHQIRRCESRLRMIFLSLSFALYCTALRGSSFAVTLRSFWRRAARNSASSTFRAPFIDTPSRVDSPCTKS